MPCSALPPERGSLLRRGRANWVPELQIGIDVRDHGLIFRGGFDVDAVFRLRERDGQIS